MNRFSETDKWKDSWFRKLPAPSKLLFLYILDTCDNAGFFELDIELCAFITKMEESNILGAVKGLKRGLIGADGRDDVFYVKNFLRHQRNLPLNPDNNAHKQIIRLLTDKKIDFKSNDTFFRGLLAPLYSKGKGKGKGKVVRSKAIEYSEQFNQWWVSSGRKGSKGDAFVRWNECTSLPPIYELVKATEKYVAFCVANERTQRDGAGFISGKLWESSWDVAKAKSKEEDFGDYKL